MNRQCSLAAWPSAPFSRVHLENTRTRRNHFQQFEFHLLLIIFKISCLCQKRDEKSFSSIIFSVCVPGLRNHNSTRSKGCRKLFLVYFQNVQPNRILTFNYRNPGWKMQKIRNKCTYHNKEALEWFYLIFWNSPEKLW